jgi:hypothetical protein
MPASARVRIESRAALEQADELDRALDRLEGTMQL